ncbi:MAG: peptidylprolyl isomerase [Pseudomonadota bacterium]|nr:MAG: peptidylprolyl isomerase [Pseudomonadota bacterium]
MSQRLCVAALLPECRSPACYQLVARFALALVVVMVALTGPIASAQESIDIDRILVVVNDDVITASELDERIEQTRRQLSAEDVRLPAAEALRRQVMERLLLERIQLQLATQSNIRASDNDVQRAVERIAQQNRMTLEGMNDYLRGAGISIEAHRAQIRDQVILQQLVDREVHNRIVVTDAEVEAFLERDEGRRKVSIEYNLSHIFLPVPDGASTEVVQRVRAQAEDIVGQVRAGTDFEQLAHQHSRGTEALKGGQLGWRRAGQLPEMFLSALTDMTVGAVSAPLRSPSGYHILRLNERRGDAPTDSVIQTHVRHILLKPSEILSVDEARSRLLRLREQIENGEDFAALARAHSEDGISAANGGDLGWVNPGQLVPEFERSMNGLELKALSEPVRSQFGLHLIQVLERREHDVSQERVRSAARRQIFQRKAEEAYEQWARRLRDEAYVEFVDSVE